ncbi:MAG: RNA polymerase sporulation sigma factor SigH [Firmicutes bacterium HGW-Firmicutes-7]|nr:MAG: RNA polymerase sporulation sigma factor SigH [Firmicutes bacterium HGW-Firmicutes-7]
MGEAIAFEELPLYNDQELVGLIRSGHDFALDFLMNKYKILVERKAKSYYLIGASKDDIIQEGMIGLFKAIRDYNPNREASFYSFADLCVTRQMISAVKASTRQKHMPLNTYISLNKPIFEEDNDKTDMLEVMPSSKIVDPEEVFIGEETKHIIEDELAKRLSKMENEILQLYVDGISYVEIAEMTDRPIKSIDNALQRIKKKVEQIIKDKQEL